MFVLLKVSQAWTDSIGLSFTYLVLLPALATGLIVVAIVAGRGEQRENDKHAGRWGRAAQRRDDAAE